MQANIPSPAFNRRIFRDVNYQAIDFDKKAGFVIERVFERVDVDDIRACRRYYGDEKIRSVLTNADRFGFLSYYRLFLFTHAALGWYRQRTGPRYTQQGRGGGEDQ